MSEPLNTTIYSHKNSTLSSGVKWAQNISPSLKKIRLGLSILYLGLVISFISIVVITSGFVLIDSAYFREKKVVLKIIILSRLVFSNMQIIGPLFCIGVPAESGSKGFLISSIVLNLIVIANYLLQSIVPMLFPSMVFKIIAICGFAGIFMFLLFIIKLSKYIGRDDLTTRCWKIFIGWVICLWIIMSADYFPVVSDFILYAFLGGCLFFIMYIILLRNLIKALGKNTTL